MKKSATPKKRPSSADDKMKISRIVDAIVAECSPLPDTTNLFSKIRELEHSDTDYTTFLAKRFSKSTIAEQSFMINHLFPHLKRFSLAESLNSIVQKETLAPRIIIDVLHYLIRSDSMINHQLLDDANQAEEIANQLSALLESKHSLESNEGAALFKKFCETPPSFQLGIVMELTHAKKEKTLPLLLGIVNTKSKLAYNIVDFLGSFTDKNSAYLLNQILKGTKDKDLSKNIKKTLYRLKNKGIEVSPPEPDTTTSKTEKKKVPLPPPTAYATTIDPLGERLILAIKPKTDQELTIFQFLTSDQKGINDLIASVTTPKDFKNYLTKIESTKEITMVEIDLAYCHFLIKESSQHNHTSGTPIPGNYFLWKKFFGEYDTHSKQATIYSLFNADEIRSQEFLLQQSEALIDKYTFTFWLLEWKLLVDTQKKIHDIEDSLLVLSEYQKDERINEIVKNTARLFFDDHKRLSFQRRLEDTAYILWKAGKIDDSKSAFAAALAFAPGGAPSDDHPFALKTVKQNVKFLKEQTEKEKRSESGRIVLP